MPTKEEWWKIIPSFNRRRWWERKYLDVIGDIPYPGKISNAVGILDKRWRPDSPAWDPTFRWNPHEYHHYWYWKKHPAMGAGEINYQPYLSSGSGLEFYVFLCMDSIYVSYERIMQKDEFYLELPAGCATEQPFRLNCEIIKPSDPLRMKHQILRGRHGYYFGLLALPVFLSLSPEMLEEIRGVFQATMVNTLRFDLVYSYARELDFELAAGLSHIRPTYPAEERGLLRWQAFLTFGRPRKYVRFLVASDIHVAERNDRIKEGSFLPTDQDPENWRAQLPPEFCNYNEQARRLATEALCRWKKGDIDYVVLNGDLIDFALKDSISARVDIEPTAEFAEEPKPYGYGEHAFEIDRAIALPNSQSAFDNIPSIEEALSLLGDVKNSNWEKFNEIFSGMMKCVHTFLVPGNHDYIVFGSELAGMNRTEFDKFIGEAGVAGLAAEEAIPAWLNLSANYRAAIVRALISLFAEIPGYESISTYEDMGLTDPLAEQYDAHRALECGPDNAFRTLLGAFWSMRALSGLHLVDGDARTSAVSDFTIDLDKGNKLRFAFLNTGPGWNQLANPSPWVRGDPEKEAIEQVKNWRNDPVSQKDMVVLFMHAPPLNRMFPSREIEDHCNRYVSSYIEHVPDSDKWPNAQCELSNLWRRPIVAQQEPPTKDPVIGAPFYGNQMLLEALCPKVLDQWPEFEPARVLVEREGPVLTFAGHTHLRHTYALKEFFQSIKDETKYGTRGWVKYDQGNDLLRDLNGSGDADVWWNQRSLIVTSGCIGPRPAAEFKTGPNGTLDRMDYGDEALGFTPPSDRQGYYIVTVDGTLGVVSKIEWIRMWYRDSIEVTSPSEGDIWDEGASQWIRWSTTTDDLEPVKIEYSVDGGAAWVLIDNSVVGGRHYWQVPLVTSDKTNCYIKVSSNVNQSISGMSGRFTINR